MANIYKDILTTKDGSAYDAGRVLWVAGIVVFLGLSIATQVTKTPFAFLEFGSGFGLMMAGAGLSLKLKENTEPNSEAK